MSATENLELKADDPRVLRIAAALAEGCNGRRYASDDAKLLARWYEEFVSEPQSSFTMAQQKAFARFIVECLAGKI